MAREFARMRVSSFDDPDLEELSADAQWLYFRVFIPHPALSAAGVMPWKPKHWVRKAKGMTLGRILSAAAELERHRNILVDLDTDELLVRSYIRNDEPLRNPRMASAVVKAYQTIASRALQAAVVTEAARIRAENPEFSSWDHKDTKAVLALMLSRPGLSAVGYTDVLAEDFTEPDPVDNTNGQAIRNGVPDPARNTVSNPVDNGVPNPDAEHVYEIGREPTNNINLNTQPATSGGYVTGERHQANASERNDPPPKHHPEHPDRYEPGCADCERTARRYERHVALALADTEPSPHCARHPGGTLDNCRDCGRARAANAQWHEDRRHAEALARSEAAHAAAETRAAAIAACAMCDDEGRIGTAVCPHDPDRMPKPGRGAAAVQLARCRLCDADGWRIPPPELRDAAPPRAECDHRPALPPAWRTLVAELLNQPAEEAMNA